MKPMQPLPTDAALILIDVQMGFDDRTWGPRNNPEAERNIARLLGAWRASSRPVIHIHHDSLSPTGSFRPGTPGGEPKPEAAPLAGEPVLRKVVNSAFIGTDLEARLRAAGIGTLVVVGLTTPHCVSTTTRMAGNLGFAAYVVCDATAAFDRPALDGRNRPAEEVHLAALSDLEGEFAHVVDTEEVLAAAAAAAARAPA